MALMVDVRNGVRPASTPCSGRPDVMDPNYNNNNNNNNKVILNGSLN